MINESLRKRLEKINARLKDVEQELANPEVTKNIKKISSTFYRKSRVITNCGTGTKFG